METYLDLLANADAAAPSIENQDRFFRALQAAGEPNVARQVAQLQRVVAADGPTAAKVRDRAELERTLVRLRYEIASAPPERLEALATDRLAAEAKLAAVDAALAGDPRFRVTDDAPVTVAALRAALRPGEAYLKVVQLRSRAFGIMVDGERAYIYALAAPAATVSAVAARVRASIRDDSGMLPFFDVAASYALFDLIAGPSRPALLRARALVIDPSGRSPTCRRRARHRSRPASSASPSRARPIPNDLSQVAFLAGRAEITGALSPRSFLIARSLPPSRAARPFIGLGENAPAAPLAAQAAMQVQFGSGCAVSYSELAGIMNANQPVSAAEIRAAPMRSASSGRPRSRARRSATGR
jgi:hypothetical protein